MPETVIYTVSVWCYNEYWDSTVCTDSVYTTEEAAVERANEILDSFLAGAPSFDGNTKMNGGSVEVYVERFVADALPAGPRRAIYVKTDCEREKEKEDENE